MIVTYKHLNNIRPLNLSTTDTGNNVRWKPYMREAEDHIATRIGYTLYHTINNNQATYQNIIEPFTYEVEGTTLHHRGLGNTIAYFVYSRWVSEMSITSTNFGMVVKTTEFSLPASPQQIRIASEAAHEQGEENLRRVLHYIRFLNLILSEENIKKDTLFSDIIAIGD